MTVFDLFSGTGTISQVLAPVAKEVIGVEIIEEAVEAAKENAARNGLENCRFIAGDVFKVLDDIEEKPDVIVLDPPRDGIHPKALPKILDYGVDTIVYISCKVTSLARDLAMFQARGYEVVKAVAVDQFCETVHVETVCLLSRKQAVLQAFMSGVQSICHPFATVIFKIITEQRKGGEHAEQSADHSQYFYL